MIICFKVISYFDVPDAIGVVAITPSGESLYIKVDDSIRKFLYYGKCYANELLQMVPTAGMIDRFDRSFVRYSSYTIDITKPTYRLYDDSEPMEIVHGL